jgi:hypothetical protein
MMTSRATIGVTAINTRPACTNQGFITCVPNEALSLYQIYFWISENKEKILMLASGATFKEINKTTFRELPILVLTGRLRRTSPGYSVLSEGRLKFFSTRTRYSARPVTTSSLNWSQVRLRYVRRKPCL